MLLILRSRAAFSLLNGSFGSVRFFSEGTSPARGWRWPIGASRTIGWLFVAVDDPPPVPVCAMAAGAPISVSSAADIVSFVVIRFRILILLALKSAPIGPVREPRLLHNCGV